MNDRDKCECDTEECDCNSTNWPAAIVRIIEAICFAAVIIAAFKYC